MQSCRSGVHFGCRKAVPFDCFLASVPKKAENTLRAYNHKTLAIFGTYAKKFADKHLEQIEDMSTLSGMRIGSSEEFAMPSGANRQHRLLCSPFVAISCHDDKFDSISDLCNTVRSGVFLEESLVPYMPIHPESTVPLNTYLYDFYKHGDVTALERAKEIGKYDVWFRLSGRSFYNSDRYSLMNILISLSSSRQL
jgi:hypothetical protein